MRVAAYQAPLAATRSPDVIRLLAGQVARCEADGVEILCCPEGVLGGLADYVEPEHRRVFPAGGSELARALAPLASATVTVIVGYTEGDAAGRLFNAAAVFHRGAVAGRYRKLHPAIRRSVYAAGDEMPVFTVGSLTFGILLCRDSTFDAPARAMVARGAAMLFVPTNNGLPVDRPHGEVAADARRTDLALAAAHGVAVIRADVAGEAFGLRAHGSTEIIGADGEVLAEGSPLQPGLVVAEIPAAPREGAPAAARAVRSAG
ncbi:MAG: carbon-nitrogen hydrolase family protein [Gemmatimonadetes bacterium]|nr:carbon-nitrogen hydrolase family protein [Gemmatimonadota bacterium]